MTAWLGASSPLSAPVSVGPMSASSWLRIALYFASSGDPDEASTTVWRTLNCASASVMGARSGTSAWIRDVAIDRREKVRERRRLADHLRERDPDGLGYGAFKPNAW